MSGRNVVRQSSCSGGSGEAFGTFGPSPLISVNIPLVVFTAPFLVLLSESGRAAHRAGRASAAIAGQAVLPGVLRFSGPGTLGGYRASGVAGRITTWVRFGCAPACRAA